MCRFAIGRVGIVASTVGFLWRSAVRGLLWLGELILLASTSTRIRGLVAGVLRILGVSCVMASTSISLLGFVDRAFAEGFGGRLAASTIAAAMGTAVQIVLILLFLGSGRSLSSRILVFVGAGAFVTASTIAFVNDVDCPLECGTQGSPLPPREVGALHSCWQFVVRDEVIVSR